MERLENLLKYPAGDQRWTACFGFDAPEGWPPLSISCAKCLINPWLCKGGFLLLNVNLQVNMVYVTEAAEDLWSIHKCSPETAQTAAPALLISSYTPVKWAPDFYISFNTRLDLRNCQPVWLTDLCVSNTGTSLFNYFCKESTIFMVIFFSRVQVVCIFSVQSIWLHGRLKVLLPDFFTCIFLYLDSLFNIVKRLNF